LQQNIAKFSSTLLLEKDEIQSLSQTIYHCHSTDLSFQIDLCRVYTYMQVCRIYTYMQVCRIYTYMQVCRIYTYM